MHALLTDAYAAIGWTLSRPAVDDFPFSAILYADDTALFGEHAPAVATLLHAIETTSAHYGMALHKAKCEHLPMYSNDRLRFADGSLVPSVRNAKYLGCYLNAEGRAAPEVVDRLRDTRVAWLRLGIFWKRANCPIPFKLQVLDAVIRNKLLYGLESARLNDDCLARINTFHLRALRQILRMRTTYVDRRNTNAEVVARANAALRDDHLRRNRPGPPRRISLFSDYLRARSLTLLGHILRSPPEDPVRQATFRAGLPLARYPPKRRVGRPRFHWTAEALRQAWAYMGWPPAIFDPLDESHLTRLLAAAQARRF